MLLRPTRLSDHGEPFDDLLHIARTGLIRAVDREDPSHPTTATPSRLAIASTTCPASSGEVTPTTAETIVANRNTTGV